MIHEHHRRLRSQGGGDEPTNVIGLPDVIHDWIHAHPEKAKEAGLIVPEWQDPAEVKVVIPEEALKKARAKREPGEKRRRVSRTIKVPVDAQENGVEILESLDELCRQELVNNEFKDAWEDDVPMYYVDVAVKYDWLTTRGVSVELVPQPKVAGAE